MGGQNFVVNGGIKMPIGFRFRPTDEELVVHYLKRKASSLPLPASIISEFDVLQSDPWSLPGQLNEKKYFFSSRYGDGSNKKCYRVAAGCGYWKPIGKERPILASGTNNVIGMRKALVFCQRKPCNETDKRWFLHQYSLVGSVATFSPNSTLMVKRESVGDWSVSRVFQRKIKGKRHGVIRGSAVKLPQGPQPDSPSPSEITEI